MSSLQLSATASDRAAAEVKLSLAGSGRVAAMHALQESGRAVVAKLAVPESDREAVAKLDESDRAVVKPGGAESDRAVAVVNSGREAMAIVCVVASDRVVAASGRAVVVGCGVSLED